MTKFHFTRKAVDDLSDIWNHTADEWTEDQADQYYEMLIAYCRKIVETPILFGQQYEEIAESKANRHINFFRIMEDVDIEIVRILRCKSRPRRGHTPMIVCQA